MKIKLIIIWMIISLQILNAEEYKKIVEKITEERLLKEINRGVQVLQYQIVTLQTTNG